MTADLSGVGRDLSPGAANVWRSRRNGWRPLSRLSICHLVAKPWLKGRKRDWNPLTHREKAVGACYGHVRAGLLGATVPMVPVFPIVSNRCFRGGQSARCGPVASGEEQRPATTTAGSRGEP